MTTSHRLSAVTSTLSVSDFDCAAQAFGVDYWHPVMGLPVPQPWAGRPDTAPPDTALPAATVVALHNPDLVVRASAGDSCVSVVTRGEQFLTLRRTGESYRLHSYLDEPTVPLVARLVSEALSPTAAAHFTAVNLPLDAMQQRLTDHRWELAGLPTSAAAALGAQLRAVVTVWEIAVMVGAHVPRQAIALYQGSDGDLLCSPLRASDRTQWATVQPATPEAVTRVVGAAVEAELEVAMG